MEKIDARKLTPRELSEKRKIAIRLREKGMPNKEVAEIVGISAQTISTYYSRYKREGKKVFKVKSAGRPKNVGKTLSDEQEQRIYTTPRKPNNFTENLIPKRVKLDDKNRGYKDE